MKSIQFDFFIDFAGMEKSNKFYLCTDDTTSTLKEKSGSVREGINASIGFQLLIDI